MEGDNLNVKYVYYAGRAGAMNGLSHWNDRFGLVAIAKEEKLKKKKKSNERDRIRDRPMSAGASIVGHQPTEHRFLKK